MLRTKQTTDGKRNNMSTIPAVPHSSYSLTTNLANTTLEAADARVRAALKDEGFGVLTEIDVQATLKKKIDADTRPYLILGACNPKLAHKALQAEPAIGVLLPCNVVLSADDEGGTTVSAVDPIAMFAVVKRPDVEPLAQEVRESLERVIAAIS